MEYKIQSIIFPTESKHQQCIGLFYRSSGGYLDRQNKFLQLSEAQNADFATYLNGCSYRKWKRYTKAGNAVLYLEAEGDFRFVPVGFSKDALMISRTEFTATEYHLKERSTIRFEFPENNEQILGFEVHTIGKCTIFGGYYSVICEKNDLNPVCLCLATTTCRKEAFIKKNVELLKSEILNADEEDIRNNIYIHVVDNGRTLSEKDIFGEHVFLHPNNNSGGSGGFARGMIESIHQKPKATHVLLMDDDVLILPESIIRTYKLLVLMKDKHKEDFISGAMLYYEEPHRQHEDIGTVASDGRFLTLKPRFNHEILNDNLENETDFVKQKNQYAGWWYCCIPRTVIEQNGLPLPIFIRFDDIEYSLRCKANIITMNGICVWHMGFATKYNAAFDKYQRCRNLLIDKSCSDIMENVDAFGYVAKSYRAEMLKFNYDTAELIVRALEDYLKGPNFLKTDRGEEIVKENLKYNDQLIPLDDIDGIDIFDLHSCYADPPRKFLDKWLFRLTYNGQRFWPQAWCKRDFAYIAFDDSYQPQKMAMHNRLVAVNPFTRTGKIRCIDKKRYRELQKRYRKAAGYYMKHKKEIISAYRKQKKYLTSEVFWRKYLEL